MIKNNVRILRTIFICTLITTLVLPTTLITFYLSKKYLGINIDFYYFLYRFIIGIIFLFIFPFMLNLAILRSFSKNELTITQKEKKILFCIGIILGILMLLFFFDISRSQHIALYFIRFNRINLSLLFMAISLLFGVIFILGLIFHDRMRYKVWNTPQYLPPKERKKDDKTKAFIFHITFYSAVFFSLGMGVTILMMKV